MVLQCLTFFIYAGSAKGPQGNFAVHIQQASLELLDMLPMEKPNILSTGPKQMRKSKLIGAHGALACTLILDEIIKEIS